MAQAKKICIKCFKPGTFKLRSDTGRLRNVCEACRKPNLLAAQRRWYDRNAPAERKRTADYCAKYPEKRAVSNQKQVENGNRDAIRNRYRARKTSAQVENTSEYRSVIRYDPCAYCNKAGGVVDHIIPLINGGPEACDNLTSACRSCNARKGSQSLLNFLVVR